MRLSIDDPRLEEFLDYNPGWTEVSRLGLLRYLILGPFLKAEDPEC